MNDVAVSLQSNEPTMTDKAVRNVVSLPDVSEGNPAFLAMRKVLEMIAAPSDCGCSPICRCGEPSSIEAERDWMRDTAKECLSLLTSNPSCIGFSLPMDWDDKILAEMDRRFELRGDHDDRMRNDDTQIGVEFAIEHIKSQMLEAFQREAFAGCGMKVSSI